ncbi:unnamed protein product, partial [Laminaria digitata]
SGSGLPRFLHNMPASYFRQTTEEARLQHLGAISAMLEAQVRVRKKKTRSTGDRYSYIQ